MNKLQQSVNSKNYQNFQQQLGQKATLKSQSSSGKVNEISSTADSSFKNDLKGMIAKNHLHHRQHISPTVTTTAKQAKPPITPPHDHMKDPSMGAPPISSALSGTGKNGMMVVNDVKQMS